MARSLRLTKLERAVVKEWMEAVAANEGLKLSVRRAAQSVADKVEGSELLSARPSATSMPVKEALEAFKEALGDRLVVSPNPGKVFWVTMSRGLGMLGADRDMCKEIAEQAAEEWTGKIRAESIVRQGAVLLSNRQSAVRTPQTSTGVTPGAWDDLRDL